jgi:hypothetical protein
VAGIGGYLSGGDGADYGAHEERGQQRGEGEGHAEGALHPEPVNRGAAHHVETETERAAIAAAGVEPWIEGEPENVIRITPARIWGHRIRRA